MRRSHATAFERTVQRAVLNIVEKTNIREVIPTFPVWSDIWDIRQNAKYRVRGFAYDGNGIFSVNPHQDSLPWTLYVEVLRVGSTWVPYHADLIVKSEDVARFYWVDHNPDHFCFEVRSAAEARFSIKYR